jgi:hypothetical protein
MLGSHRYEQMNTAELFLLGCGLYCHDWGMAVSPEEIAYLREGAGAVPSGAHFTPLPDEADRLIAFGERYGLTSSREMPVLDDDHLRIYLRETHAWRSGRRARIFFETSDQSVGAALERICQGHNLNLRDLDDERRFSAHYPVLGHEVNLCAVALYVRLTDLFDIGDDRTPYAIWRFVGPRDPRARTEWQKHRSLTPVTFPAYADGRTVCFGGVADNPDIWAQLEDLRAYCENQLTGAVDLLAHRGGERHRLDLRKLDWAITAEGFEPINIQFQFDRQQLFKIICDDIYQGDNHVFVRELLQNSIDAMRLRRDWNRRNTTDGAVGPSSEAIYFTVKSHSDGDMTVGCRDFGIGMDEHIVRNYLAVAGVSYYQS